MSDDVKLPEDVEAALRKWSDALHNDNYQHGVPRGELRRTIAALVRERDALANVRDKATAVLRTYRGAFLPGTLRNSMDALDAALKATP